MPLKMLMKLAFLATANGISITVKGPLEVL
jgi:hypothetical protein